MTDEIADFERTRLKGEDLILPRRARENVVGPAASAGEWRDSEIMHIDILPIIPAASRR